MKQLKKISFENVKNAFNEEEKNNLFETYVLAHNFRAVFDMLDGGFYPTMTMMEKIRTFGGSKNLLIAIEKCHGIKSSMSVLKYANIAEYLSSVLGDRALKTIKDKIERFSTETSKNKRYSFWSFILKSFPKNAFVAEGDWEYLAENKEWETLAEAGKFDILIDNFDKDRKSISRSLHRHGKHQMLLELGKTDILAHMPEGLNFLLENGNIEEAVSLRSLFLTEIRVLCANEEAAELMYQKGLYQELVNGGRTDILEKYKCWEILAKNGHPNLINWGDWRRQTFGDRSGISTREYKNSFFGMSALKYKMFIRLMQDGQSFLLFSKGKFELFFMSLLVK